MKAFVVALALIVSTTASAQQTVRLVNNATGELVGTATYSGRMIYLRNKDGVHFATIERNADGTRTAYDPHGKKIDPSALPVPVAPVR